MTDWLMVIITFVYVVATIFICVANFKSAKASNEQLAESKRQFDEQNRPYMSCQYVLENRAICGIKFYNCGNMPVIHLEKMLPVESVKPFEEEIIDALKEQSQNIDKNTKAINSIKEQLKCLNNQQQ